MDDDELVLMELASQFDVKFLENVGGPLFAPHLFKPLERLCEADETVVRDKVISILFYSF